MKTVIEMALDTGFDADDETTLTSLERFAAIVRADAIVEEREACAKVADHWRDTDDWPCGDGIGRAIRARSNT